MFAAGRVPRPPSVGANCDSFVNSSVPMIACEVSPARASVEKLVWLEVMSFSRSLPWRTTVTSSVAGL